MYRKRFFRRPRRKIVRRRAYRKKGSVSTNVKRYVKREIHRNIENKLVTTGNSFSVVCAKESAYYPSAQAIIPPFSFGSSGAGRLGNQVKIVKGTSRIIFTLNAYNATTNYGTDPVIVKVWFVRNLATAQQSTSLSNLFLDNIFRNGSGSVGFQGNVYDLLNLTNNDSMRVLAVRQFKLGVGYASATGPTSTGMYFDNSPAAKTITINWGKWARKHLKFDNDLNGDLPINDNIYMICQVVHCQGAFIAADYPVNCTFVSDAYYEDA